MNRSPPCEETSRSAIDALDAGILSARFWLSLAVTFVVTVPVYRWLIAMGRSHAVVPRTAR